MLQTRHCHFTEAVLCFHWLNKFKCRRQSNRRRIPTAKANQSDLSIRKWLQGTVQHETSSETCSNLCLRGGTGSAPSQNESRSSPPGPASGRPTSVEAERCKNSKNKLQESRNAIHYRKIWKTERSHAASGNTASTANRTQSAAATFPPVTSRDSSYNTFEILKQLPAFDDATDEAQNDSNASCTSKKVKRIKKKKKSKRKPAQQGGVADQRGDSTHRGSEDVQHPIGEGWIVIESKTNSKDQDSAMPNTHSYVSNLAGADDIGDVQEQNVLHENPKILKEAGISSHHAVASILPPSSTNNEADHEKLMKAVDDRSKSDQQWKGKAKANEFGSSSSIDSKGAGKDTYMCGREASPTTHLKRKIVNVKRRARRPATNCSKGSNDGVETGVLPALPSTDDQQQQALMTVTNQSTGSKSHNTCTLPKAYLLDRAIEIQEHTQNEAKSVSTESIGNSRADNGRRSGSPPIWSSTKLRLDEHKDPNNEEAVGTGSKAAVTYKFPQQSKSPSRLSRSATSATRQDNSMSNKRDSPKAKHPFLGMADRKAAFDAAFRNHASIPDYTNGRFERGFANAMKKWAISNSDSDSELHPNYGHRTLALSSDAECAGSAEENPALPCNDETVCQPTEHRKLLQAQTPFQDQGTAPSNERSSRIPPIKYPSHANSISGSVNSGQTYNQGWRGLTDQSQHGPPNLSGPSNGTGHGFPSSAPSQKLWSMTPRQVNHHQQLPWHPNPEAASYTPHATSPVGWSPQVATKGLHASSGHTTGSIPHTTTPIMPPPGLFVNELAGLGVFEWKGEKYSYEPFHHRNLGRSALTSSNDPTKANRSNGVNKEQQNNAPKDPNVQCIAPLKKEDNQAESVDSHSQTTPEIAVPNDRPDSDKLDEVNEKLKGLGLRGGYGVGTHSC